MNKVVWGIIGCGDVAEIKSGPAFQKSKNSELLAVMRRNGDKAKDFALRHKVPYWYDKVEELLQDSRINAVYIATPPSTHLELTLKAIAAGKNIYLEKPMSLNAAQAEIIYEAIKNSRCKLTVAHYRRRLPAFLKVKELLEEKAIGEIKFANIKILQPLKSAIVATSEKNWRIKPEISGGGYFHDLAPHQVDLMYHYFGEIEKTAGFSVNQAGSYDVDDVVNGIICFKNGVQLRGMWCFNVSESAKEDSCTIYGSKGTIAFSFFGEKVSLCASGTEKEFLFDPVPHVQQPMIEVTINYFLNKAANPCSAEEGMVVMEVLDSFTQKFSN